MKDDDGSIIECCFIGNDAECHKEADYMIGDTEPYMVTYACSEHLITLRDVAHDWVQNSNGDYFAPGVST